MFQLPSICIKLSLLKIAITVTQQEFTGCTPPENVVKAPMIDPTNDNGRTTIQRGRMAVGNSGAFLLRRESIKVVFATVNSLPEPCLQPF